MQKKEIRNQFQNIRKMIEDRENRERIMTECILELDRVKHANTISIYVSFGSEIDTHPLIERLLKLNKRVVVPCINDQENMVMKEIKSLDELVKVGKYQIEEAPSANAIVEPDEIDLIIVPGLAFDDDNYRLGYGGGYYDRYLKKCKAFSLGVFFSEQAIKKLPVDEHDVPLDGVFIA